MKLRIMATASAILCGMFLCACMFPGDPPVSDSANPSMQFSDTESTRQLVGEFNDITLEDMLALSDSILEAQFMYEEDCGLYRLYYFKPINQIRGRIDEPLFAVRYECRAVELTENGPKGEKPPYNFKTQREYLLVLERFISVTQPMDFYLIVGGLEFEKPLENGEGTNVYFSKLDEIRSAVKDVPLRSPAYTGKDFIRSENPAEISKGSDYVLKVRIAESSGGSAHNDTEWFFCDIIEVYKYRGVIPEGKVEIIFPSDAVSQGDEYILMLTYPDNEWPDDRPAPFYIMSSKNSIYRPDDPAVEDILREAEQAE